LATSLVRFRLTRVGFGLVDEHVRRAAGRTLPSELGAYPWIYLSGFYAAPAAPRGLATATLKTALSALPEPVVLCCEPLLGSDPRAVTAWTEHMTDTERTAKLCQYYQTQFGLRRACPIDCTLMTTLLGRGRRWQGERQFLWGLVHPAGIAQDVPTVDDSKQRCALLS
jgi:hypothetical protein